MRTRFNTKVYPQSFDPTHPLARKNGEVAVHRAVAQSQLGIDLKAAGLYVHHKDDNPLNNAPDNLEAVTPMDHCRIHRGWKRIKGAWWKTCRPCGRFLEVNDENFYRRPRHTPGEFVSKCKECNRRRLKEAYAAASLQESQEEKETLEITPSHDRNTQI